MAAHYAFVVGGLGWRVGAFSHLIRAAARTPLGTPLRQCLRSQIRSVRDEPRTWSVRPIALGDGKGRAFARFYEPRAWHKGARNIAGHRLLGAHGIDVPPRLGCGFVTVDRRPYFVIVESEVAGCSPKKAPLRPNDGYDFGRALARLHGTKYSSASARLYRRLFIHRLGLDDLTASPPLPGVDAALLSTVCTESRRLRDRDFLGPVGFSYGDVGESNFILVDRDDCEDAGRFVWIDLDDIGVLPVRLSLAAAELKLFYRDPALIAAFNEAYFAHDPMRLAEWRAFRLPWYRYYLTRRLIRIARQVRRGLSTQGDWHQRMAFVWAVTQVSARPQPDDGIATAIHDLAGARLRQTSPIGNDDPA